MDKGWRKKAIALCPIKEEDRVLDLFCGKGQMVEALCKRVGKKWKLLGLILMKR